MSIIERAKLRRRKAKSQKPARKNATVSEQLAAIREIGTVYLEADGYFLAEAEDVVFGENRALQKAPEGEGKTYLAILAPDENISVYGQADFVSVMKALQGIEGTIEVPDLTEPRKAMKELISGEKEGRAFAVIQTVAKAHRDVEVTIGVSAKAFKTKPNTVQAGLSVNIGGGNVTRYEEAGMKLKAGLEALSKASQEHDLASEVEDWDEIEVTLKETPEFELPEVKVKGVKAQAKAQTENKPSFA